MKDELGTRMKERYEQRTRTFLPRRTYTIIRADGKAFHGLTKQCKKPFDRELMDVMHESAIALCKNIQGSRFAYVQSDEISLLLTDFDTINTDAWFDGQVQKMCSVSASIATQAFNEVTNKEILHGGDIFFKPVATFDSRVFTIPDPIEVENYFIWRQQDSTRNSISMLAQSLYSHKELQGKSGDEMQEMCFQKGCNWNDCATDEKRGAVIVKEKYEVPGNEIIEHKAVGQMITAATRTRWIVDKNIPVFTQDRAWIRNLIPEINHERN
jgi:tRNA(His) 5'-end guanylyltransferase